MNTRFKTLCLIILSASALRLIPHFPNFSPIGAMAIFAGAYFGRKWTSFIVPLTALFVSDLAINFMYLHKFVLFNDVAAWIYGAFILNVFISSLFIKKVKASTVTIASIVCSVSFFIITNFGVWALPSFLNIYPHTQAGLIACYSAAIPFFWSTVAGDLFYSALMFSIFEFAQKRFPVLALKSYHE